MLLFAAALEIQAARDFRGAVADNVCIREGRLVVDHHLFQAGLVEELKSLSVARGGSFSKRGWQPCLLSGT
jgi:hypothetical protein